MGLISNIKSALAAAFAEQKPGDPPPWVGRLKEAKYVIGQYEFPFIFLDLSFFVPIKSSVFQNVDGNGGYVQHNGLGPARYPMLMVFSGPDNDLQAQTALRALIEPGDATLYHPVVGPINVVPTGELEQINRFITEANQTSIAVEFVETSGLLIDEQPPFPSALDDFLSDAANSFSDVVSIVDKAEEISFGQKVLSAIGNVKKALDAVSSGIEKTQSEMDDIFDSISESIDVLVKSPLLLARQMQQLIMTPSREISLIKDKLSAYKNLAQSFFDSDPVPNANSYDNVPKNDFAVNALVIGTATAALTQSAWLAASSSDDSTTEQGAVRYRKDFVAAQDDILSTSEDYIEWADLGAAELSATNNSGDWGSLKEIVGISVSTVTSQISVAKTEVRFTTTYDRAAMAWCYELYQSVKPDMLTYFQQTNDLGGDEILVIKSGRELVYYV